MTTSTSDMATTSGSANNNIVIGVTVGIIITILIAILIIVCVIIMYRRKRNHSVSYLAIHPSSGYYYNVAVIVGHYSVCI